MENQQGTMFSKFEQKASEFKALVDNMIDNIKEVNKENKDKMNTRYETEVVLIDRSILDMPFDDYLIKVSRGEIQNHLKLTYFEGLNPMSVNEVSSSLDDESAEYDNSNSSLNIDCSTDAVPAKKPMMVIKNSTFNKNDWLLVDKRLPKDNELIFSKNQSPIELKPMDILTRMNVDDFDFDQLEIPTVAMLQKKLNTLQVKAEKTIRAKRIKSRTIKRK